MKKKIKKKVKKKIRRAKKYLDAGFQQVDYGPNVIQTGALNQNQQTYLNAQMSNYQTGQDIANMDASMTLDMLQKQQQASASRGIDAGKELLRGDRTKEFLKGIKDRFRPDQTITGQTIGGETVPGPAGAPEGAEQAVSQLSNNLSDTNYSSIFDYGNIQQVSQLSKLPNINSNLPPGLNIQATPLPNAPASVVPVPNAGATPISIDTSKSALNQAVKAPGAEKVITKAKAPLLGEAGKIGTSLSQSALGTTATGGETAFSQFGSAASNLALPAVIIGEGTKYLSDDDDPTTMNVGETTGTILSGAGQGAGIGSMIGGPVGAGIGAIIGTGVGLVKGIRRRNKARDEEEDRKEELADLRKQYRRDRKNYLATASLGMQKGTYYMGEMGGMNPNMSFKQKLRAQMAMGGIKPMNNQGDMIVYGPTHEQGGVMRDATTELEGGGVRNGEALPGEVITQVMDDGGMNREYYFSDHLKNPSTGNTFAEDYINTGGMNQNAKQTFAKLQELVAGRTDKDRSPQTIAEDGGFGMMLPTMPSDTIQGISMDQNAAKLKFEGNLKRKGINPFSPSIKQNTQILKNNEGNFIYRYITPSTDNMRDGGMGERLDEISDQLAGASKMHAGQSKKIGSMAEQLMKKKFDLGGVKPPLMLQNPNLFPTTVNPVGYGGGQIFTGSPVGQGGGMMMSKSGYSGPIRPSGTIGGGMKVTSFPYQPAVRGGGLTVVPKGAPPAVIPKLSPPAVIPKGAPPAVVPKTPAVPKAGLGKRFLKGMMRYSPLKMVSLKNPLTYMLTSLDTGGMGGGSGSDLTGQGHVGGQQIYNDYTDDTGVTYAQKQDIDGSVTGVRGKWYNIGDNSANTDDFPTIYPQFLDFGDDPVVDTEEPVGSTEPAVDVNNIENSRPRFTVDENVKNQQEEINKFFSQDDPDLEGKTYADQYGFDQLDEDGKLGPKTKKAMELYKMAKEREADFDEARNFNQQAVDGQVAQDPVVGNIDGDADDVSITEDSGESGILDRLFGNKAALRTGVTALSYGANLLTAKKNLDELEKLKVTPDKITPERLGKIKITNEAERKMVQESTNAALNQATSSDERIALLSKQQEAIGKSEEGRRNKQLVADLEVDKINNKNAFTAEIYNVSNDFKAQIENMQIDAAAKKGRIAVMDKLSNAVATMAMDANKMEAAYKSMKEYGEAMAGGITNLSDKYMKVLTNLGLSEKEAKEIQNQVNKQG